MTSSPISARCDHADLVSAYALGILSPAEAILVEDHVPDCPQCQNATDVMQRVLGAFSTWPADVACPPNTLWNRLEGRISHQRTGSVPIGSWAEPSWEEPAPGIFCKILSSDRMRDRVAMLVRLAPGVAYPPHTHAGTEELHLLAGELWIDEKKLYPGDYNRAERGTSDRRVWSEKGCMCLLITAPSDALGE